MSVDLDWSALDAQLTLACTRFLTAAFAAAPRPDFVAPLAVTHFSFGDQEPSLTLDDIRDIQHEFIQPDDDGDDDDPDDADDPHHRQGIATGLARNLARSHGRSRSRSHSPAPRHAHLAHPSHAHSHSLSHTHPHSYTPPSPTRSATSLAPLPAPSSAPSPSFQVHLRLSYSGNISLGIATALLINYPSPAFMSLPLALTLTGLALDATLVVAFEGGRRRVHLSLLDPADPGNGAAGRTTPGARVLRAAHVESEVGQADKHVLRNVGKVEKFVLDVARQTLENELVFPNFQTIVF
ncbi:hypothetical protein JCM3770_000541 [Rhodotorula araucariae]